MRSLTVLRYISKQDDTIPYSLFKQKTNCILVCIKTQDVLYHDSQFKSISVMSRCRQLGWLLPRIYLFLPKRISQDPDYFLRKTCNPPQNTKGRRNIIKTIKMFFMISMNSVDKSFLDWPVVLCFGLIEFKNHELHQANKQLSIVLI